MILTYKIKHNRDFSIELNKAKQVAEFALATKAISSKDVKHIGLKSIIANQVLRKYSTNKKLKQVHNVNLIVPNQGVKVDKETQTLYISCLKLTLLYQFSNSFTKVNQIELDDTYAFISVTVPENKEIVPEQWIGVDLNATKHCAVVANPSTGKVLKLGKSAQHIHLKYKNARKHLQKQGKYRLVKKIKNRESRIVRDLNHKVSRKLVDYVLENNAGIVLENLKGVRKAKSSKSFKYSLNSWSFYQLMQFILYKAKLLGVPVAKIDPAYTSQQCSRCGLLECPIGHVEHADINAAFAIAERHTGMIQFIQERDCMKGNTDIPKEATL